MSERSKRELDALERLDAALPKLGALLTRLARQGIQRVTPVTVVEIRGAAQLAHTAALITGERELTSLANHVQRYLDRDPLFRPGSLLTALNRLWLLLSAVAHARADDADLVALQPLIGVARRTYEPVAGPLHVHPLAAVGWRSDTDYLGISVHVAVEGRDGLCQISVVRPTLGFGEEPRRLLSFVVSEATLLTIGELSHGAWTLHGARMSADGRLSMHRELELGPGPPRGLAAYGPYRATDWIALAERVGDAERDLLARGDGALAYIEPHAVGPLLVDDKRGVARLALRDRRGATLWARVDLARHQNRWVDNLEILADGAQSDLHPEGLFGRASIVAGELAFAPWTAVFHRERTLRIGRSRRRTHTVHLSVEDLSTVGPA